MGGELIAMSQKTLKLAVLIDADNAAHKQIPSILQEVAKYGIASVKRVYGDWSNECLVQWRDVLLPHAITPVQQFAYTKGKDATDMMLIIDAMDLLYSQALDGFCIVSSDSDFTPLASRIRESGLIVYGFGKKQTPDAFINACDKFIYTENLEPIEQISHVEHKEESVEIDQHIEKDYVTNKIDERTLQYIYRAIKDIAAEDGWSDLSAVGSYLVSVKPDFDVRTYGSTNLSKLLEKLNLFEFEWRGNKKYVRKKPSFLPFVKEIYAVITEEYGLNQWVSIRDLVLNIQQNRKDLLVVRQYGCMNIIDAIMKIDSKYFEFNEKRTAIKVLDHHSVN